MALFLGQDEPAAHSGENDNLQATGVNERQFIVLQRAAGNGGFVGKSTPKAEPMPVCARSSTMKRWGFW